MLDKDVSYGNEAASVTLIFPAVNQAAAEYLRLASRRGEVTICAASVAPGEILTESAECFHLPFIYERDFPERFLALVREESVVRIFCPVATVYAFLKQFIAKHSLKILLVGDSPVCLQMAQHHELMARARRVYPIVSAIGESAQALSLLEVASLLKFSSAIYGESSDDKLAAMIGVACSAPTGDVVEIGCLMGRSAFVLLYLARRYRLGAVLTVDPWMSQACVQNDSPPELQAVVDEWDYEVLCEGFFLSTALLNDGRHHHLRLPSSDAFRDYERLACSNSEAWNGKIGLIHIDGNHDYVSVREDCSLWLSRLTPGGWLILDDYIWAHGDGPYRVGNELISREWARIDRAFVYGKALFVRWRG